MPDFFLVGQPKSGTTALYDMLKRHPRIFMPENKEPWFFAEELIDRAPPRPEGTHARCRSTSRCSAARSRTS